MQLNWYLKSKLQLRTWLNKSQIEDWFGLWHVFAALFFKWNDAFCPKRHRFIHCSLKKRTKNGAVLNDTVHLLLPLDVQKTGEGAFVPFFIDFFPPPSLSQKDADQPGPKLSTCWRKGRRCVPQVVFGATTQWPPLPFSPLFYL